MSNLPVILDQFGVPVSSGRNAQIQNATGLGAAIGYFNPFNLPQQGGFPGSQQITQPNTIFKNLRWWLVSNLRQMLSECYVEIGLVQTICDVPVDDALRGGIEIKTEQIDEEDLKLLDSSIDRDDDINTIGQAAKWSRLYGGGGVLILTDQDPETPLDVAAIGEDEDLEFRAADLWELFWDKQNSEGYDPSLQSQNFDYFNYYGRSIHKSRVMKLKGIVAPSFIRPRLRGWGVSVVEALVRSINQYLKGTDLIFEVLDEFKVDVYKIKNLVSTLLSDDGTQSVEKRIAMGNYQKNFQHALVMDSEDDWDHKQLSFAGIGDAMIQIRMQVAADMRMPMTKLFGISAAGFNSGEDDIEVYNAMVESQIRNKIKYIILRMVEIKCQKLFGFVPNDLKVGFKPLRVLGAVEEENVKTQKFGRLISGVQLGQISAEEFRDACNRGNLLDIQLDPDMLPAGNYLADDVGEGTNDPDKSKDTDDPAAGRADTKKVRADEKGGIPKDDAKAPPPVSADAPDLKAKAPTTSMRPTQRTPLKSKSAQPDASDAPDRGDRRQRARGILNSAAFDRASYEADGGDNWIDSRRQAFFENPGNVDEALWARAKEASQAAFGKTKWQFVSWWYQKQGGKFG